VNRIARLCLVLALVPWRTQAQVLSSAPPASGFVPGQLRSQVARYWPCEHLTNVEANFDSLYKAYDYIRCAQNDDPKRVDLYFVRDTLISVTAPFLLSQQKEINWFGLDRFDQRRAAVRVWKQIRLVVSQLFGREPDSVSVARNLPDSGSSDSTTMLTALWSPTTAKPWEARLTILVASLQGQNRGLEFDSTISVQDYCVTTVPWLPCMRHK
jgi:hypothetical protein